MTRFLTCLLLTGLILQPALAKEAPKGAWTLPANETYLKIIPPPPAPGSAMARADVDYTEAVQATATLPEIVTAVRMAGFDVFTFADVLGPRFKKKHFPKTEAFFEKLAKTANVPKNFLKDHHGRPRPVDGPDKDKIKRLVPYEHGFSYPSGHSTRSWLFALVLSDLYPERRPDFIMEAARVGHSRIIGGMHYQSDVIISRALAEVIYRDLKKDETFTKDLEKLKKAEWTPPPALFKEEE